MPHALRRPHFAVALGLAGALLVTGCGEPNAPFAPAATSVDPVRSTVKSPQLLACAEATAEATSGVIGSLGGVLDLGATRASFPSGAVLNTQLFSLAELSGQHAKVDVHADGLESFIFEKPITVTIDLSHCPDISGSLTVWHVDAETGAFLENMGGVTDTVQRTITFETPHLSIYAVAN